MATIVINNSTWVANNGVFNAASGDVFVIDPGLIYSTTINGATDFSVNFEQSNPNAIVIATGQDSQPTFNWAEGADTRLTTIAANSSGAATFNVGDGATIYDVQGALLGPNTFDFGTNTTVVANIHGGSDTDTLTTGANFEVTYGSIILGRETDYDGQGDVVNIGPDSFVNGWVQTGFGSDSITIGDGFTSNGSIVSYGSINGTPGSGDTIVIGNNVSIAGNIWMLGVAPGTDLDLVSGTDDGTVNSLTIGENYTSSAGGIVGPFGDLALTVGDNWDIAGVVYTYYGTDNVVLGASADSPLVLVGQNGNDALTIEHLNPEDYVQYDGGLQDGGAMDVLTIDNLTPAQLGAFETTLSSAGYTFGDDGQWHSSNPAQWEYFYIGNNLYSDWETIGLTQTDGHGDGIVDGTDGADLIEPGYTDAQGDMVDALTNSADVFVAGRQAQVNTTTLGHQSGPVTVATADGGYFTTWYDAAYSDPAGQVRGQFFDANGNPVGDEVAIGSSPVEGWDVNEMPPLTATALTNGTVVVTWETQDLLNVDGSEAAVVQSIVSTDGTTSSATPESIVNTTTAGEQSGAVTVATADGGYFTTWYDAAYSDPAGHVHGQFFDANGNPVGNEVTIGSSVIEGWDGNEMPPLTATALSNGNVVVTWETQDLLNVDGSEAAVVQSIVTTDGTTSTASPESIVNTTTAGEQSGAVTVATADGGYFTTWYDAAYSDPAGQVHGQFFDANGNPVGSELNIGTSPVEGYDLVDMPPLTAVALDNGNVVVAWQTQDLLNVDGSQSAVVQSVIGADGSVGGQTLVNTTTAGGQSGPVLVALDTGGYFAAWYGESYGDPAGPVYGQYFDANGNPVGDELTIGTAIVDGADGFDMPPLDVAALSDGRVVVSWQTQDTLNADGSGTSVVQSLVQPAALAYGLTDDDVIMAGAGDDTVFAGLGNDTVYAGLGNDTVEGGVGDDLLYGEEGNDVLRGNEGADTLIGGAGADTLNGSSGQDMADYSASASGVSVDLAAGTGTGGDAEGDTFFGVDQVLGSDFNDTLLGYNGDVVEGGETFSNLLDGGAGNDYIDGRSGNDTLFGGAGADTVLGGSGTDLLDGGAGDDTLAIGGADTATGGTGDDRFVLDATDTAADLNATIDGSPDATDGFADDTANGDAGDILDTSASSNGLSVTIGTDGESGTVNGLDADTAADITFTEIENIALGAGDDVVDATAATGNVSVDTGAGNDSVKGGAGNDSLFGNDGNDTIWAGAGNDTVDGGTGNDILLGDAGDDSLSGGDGSDQLWGGTGADTLDGGAGDDALVLGSGDLGLGGAGDDYFYLYDDQGTGGSATIVGGETGEDLTDPTNGGDGDYLDLGWNGTAPVTADLTVIFSGDEAGTVTGGATDVTFSEIEQIATGDGNDVIDASASTSGTTIYAFGGDDSLIGGAGDDSLWGGDGNDTLTGGAGADTLEGGAGADVFTVAGADRVVDFDLATGAGDGDDTNNDVVDLSAYYNEATLADWNAANPTQTYANPLSWLRADQADGVLDAAGGAELYSPDGQPVAGADLTAENTRVVCFTRGTRIVTMRGEVAVENLTEKDRILTLDNGFKHLHWIGSRTLSGAELARHENLRPVRIAQGALGNGLPTRDLMVSQQHRVLVRSAIAERMFGTCEVLVAAKHLLELPGVEIVTECAEVEYWHFLFDQHEVVFAEGAPSESLYTGAEALKSVEPEALAEIMALFPELVQGARPVPARPFVSGAQGRKLAHRHVTNRKAVLREPGLREAS